jgi:hypothetical protein
MKTRFFTFGAGAPNYADATARLKKQAENLDLFDQIDVYNEKTLKADETFWKTHSTFIKENKRGYGYWIWKSYLIKKTMTQMEDGDVLLYLDCGCELDIKKKNELRKFFDYVKEDKIIGTEMKIEANFNKMDLILHLDAFNPNILNTLQRQAGAILFLVCPQTRDFVNKWYDLVCVYHLIDDSPSYHPNLPCFLEHRHDQAIFSLLSKKYHIFSKRTLYDCLVYERNKTGVSCIS